MAKVTAGKGKIPASPFPRAPFVYINQNHECTAGSKADIAAALQALIPKAAVILGKGALLSTTSGGLKASNDIVTIIKDTDIESATAASLAHGYHQSAIKLGCNFASVNVYYDDADKSEATISWGGNHLELCARGLTTKDTATKIYKWLFSAFAVAETLHLIPEKEMLAIDEKSFPGYTYCAIADSRKHKKDDKIQFVALITSKPAVGADGRLHWTVTDRTGTANFYFQYRGPTSKYTWDWVLALQPGDRKALPRMPMVKIKERKRVTIAKAPFRGVGMIIGGTGAAIRGVGQGLCLLGNKVKMGKSSEWVAEADVEDGKAVKKNVIPAPAKTEVKIFNEKGEKLWKWEDDDASTTAGSVYEKEFC